MAPLRLLGLVCAALVVVPVAHATPVAEIRDSKGALLAAAEPGAYSSPDYGYTLSIASSSVGDAGTVLRGVSILGGRIMVSQLFVPVSSGGAGRVEGLVVDGHPVRAHPNLLIGLGSGDYALFLQQASFPGRLHRAIGLVGLRLSLGSRQVLVGIARDRVAPPANRPLPWLMLGVPSLGEVGGPSVIVPDRVPLAGLRSGPLGVRAVGLAMGFLGVPYVWGGATPLGGFDCSGLTMYVYTQLGIHLTHFSGAQWNEGTHVPDDQLQPGDLVFFEPGRLGPGHVGIYAGNGEFIQAPHTGDVVKLSRIDEPPYAFSYVGAVRPY